MSLPAPSHSVQRKWREALRNRNLNAHQKTSLLLILWAAFPMLFFSLSTRQEYYVLPALPPLAILIAGWLAQDSLVRWLPATQGAKKIRRANLRATTVLVVLGSIFAAAALVFLLCSRAPTPSTDLASLLQQNPADYALSMGHFLDLNSQALALFRLPLALAAAALFLGPPCSYLLRKGPAPRRNPRARRWGLRLSPRRASRAANAAPVLSSQQLAAAISPQLHSGDLIVVHQEYEFAGTLGFYLRRPSYERQYGRAVAITPSTSSPIPSTTASPTTAAARTYGTAAIPRRTGDLRDATVARRK